MMKHYMINNGDAKIISMAFGLRRSEMQELRNKDIEVTDERITVTVRNTSGRPLRIITANKTYEPELREVIALKGKSNPDEPFISDKIPNTLNVHKLRNGFAKTMYRELEEVRGHKELTPAEMYFTQDGSGRAFDREILAKISEALGHNSIEVTAKYYLEERKPRTINWGTACKRAKATKYNSIANLPLFFSAEILSKIMGIGLANAYTLCHTEGFPAIVINRRIVISRDSFTKWLESQAK